MLEVEEVKTPSEYCRGFTKQGTDPPHSQIRPCDNCDSVVEKKNIYWESYLENMKKIWGKEQKQHSSTAAHPTERSPALVSEGEKLLLV